MMPALLSDPTFWVLVAFVLFVVAVFRPARKAVLGGLDSRIAEIRAMIEQAAGLRQEAQERLEQQREEERQAAENAEEVRSQAERDAERMREAAEAAMAETARRQEEQARDKIARAESAAVDGIRNAAIDIAAEASRRILAERLAGSEGEKLVEEAVEALPSQMRS